MFDTYKKFSENLILWTSEAEFLYVLHENRLIKQYVKNKKLSAPLKSVSRNYAELVKNYTGPHSRLYVPQKSRLNKLYGPCKKRNSGRKKSRLEPYKKSAKGK